MIPKVDDTSGDFDVFLSHSQVDASCVEELAKALADRAKLNVWLDKWVLVPGASWQQEMAKGLDEAHSCAVCIGKQTPSGWFTQEIERALNRQSKEDSFRVIPVLLPEAQKVNIDNFLELRTWVDFCEGLDDAEAFHRLVCGIRGVPPGRGPYDHGIAQIGHSEVRDKLLQIRTLRVERLIDDDVALEFQRRLLDVLVNIGDSND